MMILAEIAVLVVTGLAAWWLSGYDSSITDGSQTVDLRRVPRCGLTLLLVALGFPCLVRWARHNDMAGGWIFVGTMTVLAVLWAGCVSTVLAQAVQSLLMPEDKREYDPRKATRDLDQVASLVQAGRRDEAIQLCRSLADSGDASALAMRAMVEQLTAAPAAQLTASSKETIESLLVPNQAPPSPPPPPAPTSPALAIQPSVEQLLADGGLGSAIELLEQQIHTEPNRFDLRLKLAEAHAVFCRNPERAAKLIDQLERNPSFTAAQVQEARTRLKEWRKK